MSEIDRLLSTARMAQEERKRAQKSLEVALAREADAVAALRKATDELTAGLPAPPARDEEIVLIGDTVQHVHEIDGRELLAMFSHQAE